MVYSRSRRSELARRMEEVLGFDSPSFTHGADLMLPATANSDLRELLVSNTSNAAIRDEETALATIESLGESENVSVVPQVK